MGNRKVQKETINLVAVKAVIGQLGGLGSVAALLDLNETYLRKLVNSGEMATKDLRLLAAVGNIPMESLIVKAEEPKEETAAPADFSSLENKLNILSGHVVNQSEKIESFRGDVLGCLGQLHSDFKILENLIRMQNELLGKIFDEVEGVTERDYSAEADNN